MRAALPYVLLLLLAACGGGGGGSASDSTPPATAAFDGRSITSAVNGSTYALRIHVPRSAGPRPNLPTVYALDGDSWFETLVGISDATPGGGFIVVAIANNGAQRSADYVPANSCTPNGGGHVAYLEFLRRELIPAIENSVGGDPARRILAGHSHGGSFAVYAMFAQAPGQHAFAGYVTSDASLQCMPATAFGWDEAYEAANGKRLPVRLHLSYASGGNFAVNRDWAAHLQSRGYAGLALQAQGYAGSHGGIVPAAYADAMAFMLR